MKKKIIIFLIPVLIYGLIVLTNNNNVNKKIDKDGYTEGNDDNKYVIEWQNIIAGGGNDSFYDNSAFRDEDGYLSFGYFGSTNIEGIEQGEFISKHNVNGDLVFIKNIDVDINKNVLNCSDSFLIVTKSNEIIKYDENGNIKWQKELIPADFGYTKDATYNTYIYGTPVAEIGDGYIVIVSLSNNSENYYNKFITKFNKNGNIEWYSILSETRYEFFDYVEAVNDELFVFGRYSNDIEGLTFNGENDIFIIKYDLNGNMIWKKGFGGNKNESLEDVYKTNDGFILNINSDSDSIGEYTNYGREDSLILKIDLDGNILWMNNWGGSDTDFFHSFIEVDDGYIVNGITLSGDIEGIESNGHYDAILIKYDKNGNLLWKKNWGGSSPDKFNSVVYINGQIVAISDYFSNDIDGIDTNNINIMVVTFDRNGNLISQQGLEFGTNISLNSVIGENDGFILFLSGIINNLSGFSKKMYYGSIDDKDAVVIKYTNDISKEIKFKKKISYNSYIIGDKVTYRGSNYHVIKNSDDKYTYVKLLKDDALTTEELNIEDNNDIPMFAYASDEHFCMTSRYNYSCTTNYDNTVIKPIVDGWAVQTFGDNLYEIDGYKARLISYNDMIDLGYEDYSPYGYSVGMKGDSSKSWINYNELNFWAMDGYFYKVPIQWWEYGILHEDGYRDLFSVPLESDPHGLVYKCAIRPVVNVNKSSIGSSDTYNIGDKVTYKGEDYYVINQVSTNDEYVTLLKYVPLTNSQVDHSRNIYNAISYYQSDSCNSKVKTGCNSSYIPSDINKKLHNWSNDFKDDLKSEVLLINYSDLERLGYTSEYADTYTSFHATEDTPSFVYDLDKVYWMMESATDSSHLVSVVQYYVLDRPVYETALVRPVIYLDKCAIEDGCVIEYVDEDEPDEVIYDDPESDPDPEIDPKPYSKPEIKTENKHNKESDKEISIVEVENTLKNISIISIIVGLIMVIIGAFIYKKNHKNVNNK